MINTITTLLSPIILLACYVLVVTIIECIKDLYKWFTTPKLTQSKRSKPRKKQARDARGRYTNKTPEPKTKHSVIVNYNGTYSHTITL